MVKLSQVFLFGTKRLGAEWERAAAIEECMHTHPDGRYMDEPTMSEAEAEEMLDTGKFPDSVWERYGGH